MINMYATLLGKDGFRKGMDLYFERHDGQAVTCDDFRAAMADANAVADGLLQFEQWYTQAGTPSLAATPSYDEQSGRYTLELAQSCAPTPGQAAKPPLHIPVAVGLLDRTTGRDLLPEPTLVLELRSGPAPPPPPLSALSACVPAAQHGSSSGQAATCGLSSIGSAPSQRAVANLRARAAGRDRPAGALDQPSVFRPGQLDCGGPDLC